MIKQGRGKPFAALVMALALLVGIGSLLAAKNLLLEEWYLHCLKSKSEPERSAALERLVQMRSGKAVPYLLDFLRAPAHAKKYAKKLEAIRSVARIGPPAMAAARLLSEILWTEKQEWEGHGCSMTAGSQPGKTARPSGSCEIHDAAADALVRLGPEVISVLLRSLVDVKGDLNDLSSRAAPVFQRLAPESIPCLAGALKQQESDLRSASAYLLRRMGKDALPALLEAIRDEDRSLRLWAMVTIRSLRKEAKSAGPLLFTLLENPNEDIELRLEAVRALSSLGHAKGTIPFAVSFLRVGEEHRHLAAKALAESGPEAVPALLDLLKDTDEKIRLWAQSILWEIGAKDDSVKRVLRSALADQDPNFRDLLGQILDWIGN